MQWSDYLDCHQAQFVDGLLDFVCIPSVSATDAHKADVVHAGNGWSVV